MIAKIKYAWEKIMSNNHRHIELDKRLVSEDSMLDYYKKQIIRDNDFKNKTIIDYGFGGGWLGKLLLSEFDIKHYVGYDISKVSYDFAMDNLKEFEQKTLLLVNNTAYNFHAHQADYFICLACIQHFPNQTYLNDWLGKVNKSGIKNLILQIRNNGTTFFRKSDYTNAKDVIYACHTNPVYLKGKLPDYKLVYDSKTISHVGIRILQYEHK